MEEIIAQIVGLTFMGIITICLIWAIVEYIILKNKNYEL